MAGIDYPVVDCHIPEKRTLNHTSVKTSGLKTSSFTCPDA
jgi:hypothetical protein